jgi:hypothetical protein
MALVCCLVADPPATAGTSEAPEKLAALARACSPRIEPHGDRIVVFDASGLTQVLGTPIEIASGVSRLSVGYGLTVRVALAGTTTAAWLLAHARPGSTVVAPGDEPAALSALPLRALTTLPEFTVVSRAPVPVPRMPRGRRRAARAGHYRMAPGPAADPQTARLDPPQMAAPQFPVALRPIPSAEYSATLAIFERWGLRTLGDLARLPRADVRSRLGDPGVRLHEAACGEDSAPLVPVAEAVPFVDRLVLEWPIEGLEPLSFVLSRLCDALSARLEQADRGAVVLSVRLRLVTRTTHERRLELPAPLRDARVLRTLLLLDLESHPPPAAIDIVEVECGVAPGRIVQGSLLARAVPTADDLATLLARLRALMGESRVGAPALVDSHDDRRSAMTPFHVTNQNPGTPEPRNPGTPEPQNPGTPSVLRRFRLPLAASVVLERGLPVRVVSSACGAEAGRVTGCAGPWRTSGYWWAPDRSSWDREEWEVELADGVYRLSRDRTTGRWEIEGAVD